MYRYYATSRAPVALWMLDDTAPFLEHSGSNLAANMASGVPTKSVPLVSGAEYSSVFKTGVVGRFTCNLFKQGREDKPFALEAWILPIPKTNVGVQKVLSHSNVDDGITINGKVIRFGTVYTNSGSAFCDYDLGEYKLAHVVGIHNQDQNQLWVNGELVAQVDLTEEQRGDTYNITDNTYLYAGTTSSTQEVAMNAVSFYPTISGDDIKRNYEAGINFIGQDRVTPQLGGVTLDLSADANSIFIEEDWTAKFEFERGLKDSVEYAEDQIEPSYVDGVSVPGTWTVSVPLDAQNDPSIYGVMVAWSSHNVSVDVSLDGAAWTPAVSGRLVSIIPNGYNPSGKDLQVRVSFAGGLAEDPSFLESLRVVGYRDNTIQNITARPLSATHPAVVRRDFEPNLYRDDNGVRLGGGTLTIGPDTSPEPEVARTVELWIKPLSGTPTISVGGTRYRNGVADFALPVGEWSLVHIVASADITSDITVSGDAIIGQATLYPDALTASDVDFIWRSYIGRTALRFEENTATVVSEDATPVVIYAHDWAIDSAG